MSGRELLIGAVIKCDDEGDVRSRSESQSSAEPGLFDIGVNVLTGNGFFNTFFDAE